MKAAIIAAPMTGSGKTTVMLGLLSALAARGLAVQAFKVGPDFIDPGLHQLASGHPSHNLDGWMLSPETNLDLFSSAAAGKDVAIVEGVMGLFDGFAGSSDAGSTAEMARWLNTPVILVIDANPLARSAAAMVHGFRTYNPELEWAGVIFNRVASESHFRILQEAVRDVPILGWLPSNPDIEIPERHLGLLTADEPEVKKRVSHIGEFLSRYIDVDRLINTLPDAKPHAGPGEFRTTNGFVSDRVAGGFRPQKIRPRRRVAIARDPAFSFYYHANCDAMVRAGAEIIEFSAVHDSKLPEAEFLYLGGGYPEIYRHELAANHSMLDSVRQFIASGKRFYAECGGLMYLSRRIEDSNMVGILPTEISLTDRPVDFGYCEVTAARDGILGPAGTRMRGHQFHYSKSASVSPTPAYRIRQGPREYPEGWYFPNGIASYVHLHFLSNPEIVRNILG
jgi:cobyrinic acid a,c-diamide synthase